MIIADSFQWEEIQGFRFGSSWWGKPTMFSHLYYVDGLLIDTGHSNMQKHILNVTKDLDVDQLFITHHHEDHTGNVSEIQQQHNCPVYAFEACCEMMKDPPPLTFAQKITWGSRPSQQQLIAKNEFLETRNYRFQLIPIPGHAPDMVALYEPDRQWLLSADLYINSYIDYFIDGESMLDQINSTKRVLELEFDALLCSHRPRLTNGKKQLAKKLRFLESFFEEVAEHHSTGYSAEVIFKHMKLTENHFVKLLSGGYLSKLNMVKAVIRDLEKSPTP